MVDSPTPTTSSASPRVAAEADPAASPEFSPGLREAAEHLTQQALEEVVQEPSSPVGLFNSNLDATLIGTPGAARHFAEAWATTAAEERPVLVYNSGRSLDDMRAIVADNTLPEPDYYVSGVGTQLYDVAADRMLQEYSDSLCDGWDLGLIEKLVSEVPGVERQPDFNQNPIKSSWYLDRANRETIHLLREKLKSRGLQVSVVYSGFRYLDVLPARTNKGLALNWLCEKLGIRLAEVVVAGSSANDASCYFLPGVRGIAVENAKPELFEAIVGTDVYRCKTVMSEGIVEGLVHFGVIDADKAPSLSMSGAGREADPQLGRLFDASQLAGLTEFQQTLLCTAYDKAVEAVRRCITPLGFSAASLPDNEITGTDENYHSVWSRDGCITVMGTMNLDDPDIRQCQRRTLETLIQHISPAGQLPANVRLASHQPDYSGVGGICAVDSNLWVMIATYHYVNKTGDKDFLRKHRHALQRGMDWISAHDSNNDGLLEVPEASDWTDLFGRSYNVLYDEVLWYRANVCFGRLQEMLGEHQAAANYLDWSQFIQGKILHTFWPQSTTNEDGPKRSFADSQFSVGDARYLLAEVTPFSFNWRCDVYGNVLAFLMGLLDAERARTALAFLWGCGVNEPYPVANLYPVVQAGDPDWKSYYAVNLLNLPHHYHNGGIWPFVGGMWCRFIHRLGQHDVACQELVRLAKVNRLGTRDEWEFNEWAHGQTGRPMGKRYQAWSAASFIRACEELQVGGAEDSG
ncbi:MAG: HAD family hydrolase [Planctomycetota bacterium]